jgi:hypothetical protein
VTVEPILPYLIVEAVLSGYVLDITVGGFGSYFDEMLNEESSLSSLRQADLVFVVLELEDIAGKLARPLCGRKRGWSRSRDLSWPRLRVLVKCCAAIGKGTRDDLVMQGVRGARHVVVGISWETRT